MLIEKKYMIIVTIWYLILPLVIMSIEDETELKQREIDIPVDKEIYFLDKNSSKIYEAYSINNIKITRYLGHFHQNGQSFIPANDISNSVMERRGNFYGIELVCMLEPYPPLINLPVDFKSHVSYYSNNQTYDLTNIVTGAYIDVLQSLEKIYNFSTKFYHRKDGKWGSGILPNGTIGAEGMLLNLVEGSADMVAPFTMMSSRLVFVDFGPIFTVDFLGLYIPRHSKWENIDWTVFVEPFNWKLWMTLFAAASLFTTCIYIMEWSYLNDRPVRFHSLYYVITLILLYNYINNV